MRALLLQQERIFDPVTIRHLNEIGVREGWRCADIGAGTGSIARWLARRVGMSGAVVATDIDTRFLATLASSTLSVRRHDIVTEPLEFDAFDLVHARLFVARMPELTAARDAALAHMLAALKPGAWLLAEACDIVMSESILPASELQIKAAEALRTLYARSPEDRFFGRKLRSSLQALQLERIHTDVSAASASTDVNAFALALEQQRVALASAHLLTDGEIDLAIAEAAHQSVADAYYPLMVAAWGQRHGA